MEKEKYEITRQVVEKDDDNLSYRDPTVLLSIFRYQKNALSIGK